MTTLAIKVPRIDTRRLREAVGLSLNRWARELGVGRRTVMRWENEAVEPSPLAREQLKRFQDQVAAGENGHRPERFSSRPARQTYVPASEPLRRHGVVPSATRPKLARKD